MIDTLTVHSTNKQGQPIALTITVTGTDTGTIGWQILRASATRKTPSASATSEQIYDIRLLPGNVGISCKASILAWPVDIHCLLIPGSGPTARSVTIAAPVFGGTYPLSDADFTALGAFIVAAGFPAA